jgi:hypothetical protein
LLDENLRLSDLVSWLIAGAEIVGRDTAVSIEFSLGVRNSFFNFGQFIYSVGFMVKVQSYTNAVLTCQTKLAGFG